jgi:hypothetical protein
MITSNIVSMALSASPTCDPANTATHDFVGSHARPVAHRVPYVRCLGICCRRRDQGKLPGPDEKPRPGARRAAGRARAIRRRSVAHRQHGHAHPLERAGWLYVKVLGVRTHKTKTVRNHFRELAVGSLRDEANRADTNLRWSGS